MESIVDVRASQWYGGLAYQDKFWRNFKAGLLLLKSLTIQ